jgi:hypothetical protein
MTRHPRNESVHAFWARLSLNGSSCDLRLRLEGDEGVYLALLASALWDVGPRPAAPPRAALAFFDFCRSRPRAPGARPRAVRSAAAVARFLAAERSKQFKFLSNKVPSSKRFKDTKWQLAKNLPFAKELFSSDSEPY